MCLLTTKFLVSLYSSKPLYVCFYAKLLTHFISCSRNTEQCHSIRSASSTNSNPKPHSRHALPHCRYRNSVCDSMLCITVCLPCNPLWTKELLIGDGNKTLFTPQSQKRRTLCVTSQDIFLLKGTTHQLSVYDKMQTVCRFSMPIFHFSSVSGPLQEDSLKNKINRMHKLAHTNKYRQLLATLCGQVFPMTYSYTECEKPLWPTPLGILFQLQLYI